MNYFQRINHRPYSVKFVKFIFLSNYSLLFFIYCFYLVQHVTERVIKMVTYGLR